MLRLHKQTAVWLILLLISASASAQIPDINRVEYYIDSDPGRGNGTAVTITPAADINGISVPVSVASLSAGVHMLVTRSLDANGNWSLDNLLLFLKPFSAPAPQPNITALEYFIDTDPGRGIATGITITPATDISNLSVPVPINALTNGMHLLAMRSHDANGNWSMDNYWLFFKSGSSVPVIPAVTALEYFIDTDPGRGQATPVSISPSTDISGLAVPVPINAFIPGIHILSVRSRDANGNWSFENRWLFAKAFPGAGVIPNITTAEYFIDADPGQGAGHPVTITPGQDVSGVSVLVPLNSLTTGSHSFYLRTLDANGSWSLINKLDFNYTNTLPLSLLDFAAWWNARQEVTVEWSTSSEQNSRDFGVYRRGEQEQQWTLIGSVPAAGNSSTQRRYQFNDANPLPGTSFYRLQSNDIDGKFTLSPIARITRQTDGFRLISMNPQPVQQTPARLTVSYPENGTLYWLVFDMQGKLLQNGTFGVVKGMNSKEISLSTLSRGTYILKLCDMKGGSVQLKFLRQ